MTSKNGERSDCRARAVRLIGEQFGPIGDLPTQLWPVIWVTVYRSCEVAMDLEANGGANAIVKKVLLHGGQAAYEMERSIRNVGLMKDIVPVIRASKSTMERLGDSQLLIDILKWNITNAGELSVLRRVVARQFARADSLYELPVPEEIL